MAHASRPDRITIGNHTYTIQWFTHDEWADERLDEDADAVTFARSQRIILRLDPHAHESHYQETLIHELTHAIWDSTMLTHIDLTENSDAEEFICSLQSPPLLGILKANPLLVKYLVSDGEVVR